MTKHPIGMCAIACILLGCTGWGENGTPTNNPRVEQPKDDASLVDVQEPDDSSDSRKPEAPAPVLDCWQMSEKECYADNRCMPVAGVQINEFEQCLMEKTMAVCMDLGNCSPIVTFARSPTGELWKFAQDCSPPGWMSAEVEKVPSVSCKQPIKPADCTQLSKNLCKEGCTRIDGSPVREAEQCYEDYQFAACSEPVSCPLGTQYARNPSGQLWKFLVKCIPDGWVLEEPDNPVEYPCPHDPHDVCSDIPLKLCEANEACKLMEAYRIDESGQCTAATKEAVACGPEPKCPGSRCARSPSGESWHFPVGCTPAGWPVVQCEYWPACSE